MTGELVAIGVTVTAVVAKLALYRMFLSEVRRFTLSHDDAEEVSSFAAAVRPSIALRGMRIVVRCARKARSP